MVLVMSTTPGENREDGAPQQNAMETDSEKMPVNNSKENTSNKTNDNDIPKGKVSCLLCRGFISYKNSDRARFRDHMSNEHDVKFDHDVILAISVMSFKEKQHIVQSAMARLNEVSNNKIPSSGEALLPKAAPPSSVSATVTNSGAVSRLPVASSRGRGQISSSVTATPVPTRGGVSINRGRGAPAAVRPQRGAATGGKVPFNIQNMSISISVVDQTVKCSQCSMTFKNSNLLAEHTKSVHLARFASLGLSITTPGEKKNSPVTMAQSPGVKRPRPPDAVRTPPTKVMVQQGAGGRGGVTYARGRGRGAVAGTRVVTQVKTEPVTGGSTNTRAVPQTGGTGNRVTQQTNKVDPVIKCNDCAQYIKQSIFKEHKLSHAQDQAGGDNTNTNQPASTSVTTVNKPKVSRKKDEKQVDYVDLGEVSDEEEVTDITKKKVLEKKLPCPSCDVMFATTMSLKMHMNLSHPVKTEATETEQLLTESGDDNDPSNEDNADDKVRDEMNSLGTSEMLDDLVNFLNEL